MSRQANMRMGGWVLFAGVIMVLVGAANAFAGLIALIDPEAATAGASGALIADVSTWGFVQLVLGVLIALAGIGVMAVQTWARAVGIGLAGLNLLAHLGNVDAHPLWSLVIIALDVVVIYALAVYYDPYAAES
ncbi:MAG: hypothetical protein WD004_02790 [Actinomycetota bacterium]